MAVLANRSESSPLLAHAILLKSIGSGCASVVVVRIKLKTSLFTSIPSPEKYLPPALYGGLAFGGTLVLTIRFGIGSGRDGSPPCEGLQGGLESFGGGKRPVMLCRLGTSLGGVRFMGGIL